MEVKMILSREELNRLSEEEYFNTLLKGLNIELNEDEKNTVTAVKEASGTNVKMDRAFDTALIMY